MRVLKRDKSTEAFDREKITVVIDRAFKDIDLSKEVLFQELELFLQSYNQEEIESTNIQNKCVDICKSKISIQEPEWNLIAGRLFYQNVRKDILRKRKIDYTPEAFVTYFNYQIENNRYDKELNELYSQEELITLSNYLNPDRDLDFSYPSIKAITGKYLIPEELPQELFLTISLSLHKYVTNKEQRLLAIKETYELLSTKKISLATPILLNLRKPKANLSSCFILDIGDDIESIFHNISNSAFISKNSGGVGIHIGNIRARGSDFQNKPNLSGGIIPFVKLFNDTALAINQGGVRAGAITVALPLWHGDILDFLECQKENGSDLRQKSFDIFPQVLINNLFLEYYLHNKILNSSSIPEELRDYKYWYLVCPHEIKTHTGVNLNDLHGDKFKEFYENTVIPLADSGKLKVNTKVRPISILKTIIENYIEKGLPYISFIDTINESNANDHEGNIPCTNLCVVPETRILTDKGYLEIGNLENQTVNVWNGEEFSETIVRKTGENQEIIKVNLSNGVSIDCTPYHGFYIQQGNTRDEKIVKVEARNLKSGDKLIKYNLPVIENESDISLDYAYTQGFYCGDGSQDGINIPEIYLYHKKRELVPLISTRDKLRGSSNFHGETTELPIYEDKNQKRVLCKLPLDVKPKFFVPLNGYTIQSRLDWFSGLCDSDGYISRNQHNESIQICSINKVFLLSVRLMLQTLGVDSKISINKKASTYKLPEGKGVGAIKDYEYKTVYRLIVTSVGLYQLSQLGFKTNRLKWKINKPQRNANQFTAVVNIENNNRISDTFCFHEKKRTMGMFEGLLLSNCVESFSIVKKDSHAHCCNLMHVNLSNCDSFEDVERYSKQVVRNLDTLIDINTTPIPEALNHNERYRTIGLCTIGLADWLAKNNYNYFTGLDFISETYERSALAAIEASILLAKEKGQYPGYKGSQWDRGIIHGKTLDWYKENSKYPERWEKVFKDLSLYGVRNSTISCIAPNTSSSLIQDCTASFLPPYQKMFIDSSSKGSMIIMPPYIKEKFAFYNEGVNVPASQIIKIVSDCIQPWISKGVSMELWFQRIDSEGNKLKASTILDCILQAWRDKCKAIYYIRTHDPRMSEETCSSCAG